MQKDPNEIPSYYAIIPANVRYDDELKANEKLLYGEITALSQRDGKCWASNGYFAKLYGVSTVCVSGWIRNLKEKGYIESVIVYKEGSKQILYRYLTFVGEGIKEKFNTPIKEKFKDNNTSNNNTSVIKEKEKKEKTSFSLSPKNKTDFKTLIQENFTQDFLENIKNSYEVSEEELKQEGRNFVIYWTEKNPQGKKEKWEMEKTFDIQRRFYKWLQNSKKWNKKFQKEQTHSYESVF